jgi:hypothetical protein
MYQIRGQHIPEMVDVHCREDPMSRVYKTLYLCIFKDWFYSLFHYCVYNMYVYIMFHNLYHQPSNYGNCNILEYQYIYIYICNIYEHAYLKNDSHESCCDQRWRYYFHTSLDRKLGLLLRLGWWHQGDDISRGSVFICIGNCRGTLDCEETCQAVE